MPKHKLTAKNYHSDKNPYLSNSKISLFLKSKEAYAARYITKTDEGDMSASLLIGRMVDIAFEKGKVSAIDREFVCMDLKTYRESGEERTRVTPDQMDKARRMANVLIYSDLYKDLKEKHTNVDKFFQKVLVDEKRGFAGMLDLLIVNHDTKKIMIIDLKTCSPSGMRNAKSYFYHCLEYSYFRQLAGYMLLVENEYPDYEIDFAHITISSDEYPQVKLFNFDKKLIERELKFIDMMIEQIINCTDWIDHIPTWDEIITIKDPNEPTQFDTSPTGENETY